MTSVHFSLPKYKTKSLDQIYTLNTDDFIIGDRVWVLGNKPGYIQYIGDTHFGGGEWAGVVLDDYSGKNDGSVGGIRYFQCAPKRGVFSRLHKLTRYPITTSNYLNSAARSISPVGSNGGSRSGSSSPISNSSLRSSTPTRVTSPSLLSPTRPRLGDVVLVKTNSGITRTGILRYWGTTDFAPGEWAGVELDIPVGKNNGTVAGKRYFECSPLYGLFAPTHKVTRATVTSAGRRYHNHDHDHHYRHHYGTYYPFNSSYSTRVLKV